MSVKNGCSIISYPRLVLPIAVALLTLFILGESRLNAASPPKAGVQNLSWSAPETLDDVDYQGQPAIAGCKKKEEAKASWLDIGSTENNNFDQVNISTFTPNGGWSSNPQSFHIFPYMFIFSPTVAVGGENCQVSASIWSGEAGWFDDPPVKDYRRSLVWIAVQNEGQWGQPDPLAVASGASRSFVGYPSVAVSPSGTVVASWKREFEYQGNDACVVEAAVLAPGRRQWLPPARLGFCRYGLERPVGVAAGNNNSYVYFEEDGGVVNIARYQGDGKWRSVKRYSYAMKPLMKLDRSGRAIMTWLYGAGEATKLMVAYGSQQGNWGSSNQVLIGDISQLDMDVDQEGHIVLGWAESSERDILAKASFGSISSFAFSEPAVIGDSINGEEPKIKVAIDSSGNVAALWLAGERTGATAATDIETQVWSQPQTLFDEGDDRYLHVKKIGLAAMEHNVAAIWETCSDWDNYCIAEELRASYGDLEPVS